MSVSNWSIEIIMAITVLIVDFSADSLQVSLGAPIEMRVITNVGIWMSAIVPYFAIRIMSMRRLGKRWRHTIPLAEMLFGKKI